jgi:four helix bundle protein
MVTPNRKLLGQNSRLRRAAVSIPVNMVEAHGRNRPGDDQFSETWNLAE